MRAGLLTGTNLSEFRRMLDDEGLHVAMINGFPYGPFHGTPVKASVYAPDWRDPARVSYTLDLVRILQALVPDDVDGGVSTAPLSYKPWMAAADSDGWETITRNVVRVAERLAQIHQDSGALIHLDIEPEPDCSLENTAETLEFFERRLLPRGAPMARARAHVSEPAASDLLLEHIRVCFDCCHFAVEFEDAAVALDRFENAGVKIGRVQLSSALDVTVPADKDAAAAVDGSPAPVRRHDLSAPGRRTARRRAAALPRSAGRAGARGRRREARTWRIHFHVRCSPPNTACWDRRSPTSPTCCTTSSRHRPPLTSRSKPTRGTCCPATSNWISSSRSAASTTGCCRPAGVSAARRRARGLPVG